MREVNFSIPNVNKASVGITTALYDRRALDCTSTLPLINSLTHLVYLTTSSARIRDILTVDGGVERLVNILKAGRSKDMMVMWMWNLAFQCVVNIGVRGSENVRTRVVEADMVPVIATILDNYIQVIDKYRSKAEAKKIAANGGARTREAAKTPSERHERIERPHRRQAPASIEIPLPFPRSQADDAATTSNQLIVAPHPPPSGNTLARSQDSAAQLLPLRTGQSRPSINVSLPTIENSEGFPLRPVREADRLPSMLPGVQTSGPSQPGSPTTPNTLTRATAASARVSRRSGRPSIRHQRSMSGESDDANNEDITTNVSDRVENTEPIIDIQTNLEAIDGQEGVLEPMDTQMGTENQESDTFNITHRSPLDGSLMNHTTTVNTAIGFSPVPTITAPSVNPPSMYPRFLLEHPSNALVLVSMPREEDVLLSLQLLAYVSKYCNLRTYFQKSHLVPNLSISNEIHLLDDDTSAAKQPVIPPPTQEEYLLPDDFNIFPLVEKFTVRHHPPEMQYWAGVVMRNLCRKDDTRGGIRQCAYYECGKWEQYTRQFAKCRRCRRTKYCSKECQKSAWVYHRHWCVAAQP